MYDFDTARDMWTRLYQSEFGIFVNFDNVPKPTVPDLNKEYWYIMTHPDIGHEALLSGGRNPARSNNIFDTSLNVVIDYTFGREHELRNHASIILVDAQNEASKGIQRSDIDFKKSITLLEILALRRFLRYFNGVVLDTLIGTYCFGTLFKNNRHPLVYTNNRGEMCIDYDLGVEADQYFADGACIVRPVYF